MSKEIWKDIKGCEGLYQVSSLGRIKSLERRVPANNGSIRTIKERILKQSLSHNGYAQVSIRPSLTSKKTIRVHREVGLAFIPNPKDKPAINHISGDKTDNRKINLEWVTNKENTSHAFRTGLHRGAWKGKFKESNKTSKEVIQITTEDVAIQKFCSIREASLVTAIDATSISRVCNRKRGATIAGGYKWKFSNKET